MEVKADLIRMFEYDLWATNAWMPFAEIPEVHEVLEHMIWAQAIWLARCGGSSFATKEGLLGLATELNTSWKEHLAQTTPDEMIRYQNNVGNVYTQSRHDIARHVINHGTYHRGHLRGLAQAMELEDFPNTDYILYLWERGS